MRIIDIVATGLTPADAQKLVDVRTQNRKEVLGDNVYFQDITPDTLPADIRAIGREVEYITRIRQLEHTVDAMHISRDLDRIINRLAAGSAR